MPVSVCATIAMYCIVGVSANHAFTRTVGYSLNAFAFASLILWTVQRRDRSETAVFRLAPVRFLGKISYGLYLLQLPVQAAVKIITGTPLGSVQRTPLQSLFWFATTLVVAWLSWRFFEKPILDWGNRSRAAEVSPGLAAREQELEPTSVLR